MRNKAVQKVTLVSSALLMGITVCVSVWFFLREHKAMEIRGQNRPTLPNNEIASDRRAGSNLDEVPLSLEESVGQRVKSYLMSSFSEEQLATPFAQKMLEAMDSPEYFALLRSDFTERQLNDFLESQGVPVIRGHSDTFRKLFPTGEPADYEPKMRRKLADLFIAAESVDLTDPVAAERQRRKVFLEFIKTDRHSSMVWFLGQFGEDWDGAFQTGREGVKSNPAFIWLTDVQQNAASIVAASETVGVDTPETQASAPSWDLSSVMESSSASHNETEMPATFDTPEHSTMTDTEIEAAIEKSLRPQPPGIPTNQHSDTPGEIQNNLETSLKAQLSPERFERAMSTLERYGPEEGLRRLRETDPEVANQIERHRSRSRSEDSDKSEEEVPQ